MSMSSIPLLIHGVLFMMFSMSSNMAMPVTAGILALASYGQWRVKVLDGFWEFRTLRGWATLFVLLGGVFSVAYVFTGGVFDSLVIPMRTFFYLGWLIVGLSVLDFQQKKVK